GPDRLFVPEAVGHGGTRLVGVVPALAVPRRAQRAAAGHLQVAVGVRLPDPIPGVAQPVRAVLRTLVREPGDLVIAPDPDATRLRLPRLLADAPVVQLHQVGQVVALPAAWRQAALAPAVDAVGEAYLQGRFLRLVGNLLDPQREGVEVQQQLAFPPQAAARDVGVAHHQVPAAVLGRVGPNQAQHLRPVRQLAVVAVHDLGLA